MPTASSRAMLVSRSFWMRVSFGSRPLRGAIRAAWHRAAAARRRAQEWRALRELSPGVLRDIGLSPELRGELHHWRERERVARESALLG